MRFGTLFVVIAAMLMFGLGCGSEAASYCSKADECNALSGRSKSECEDIVNKCVDTLTSSQRKDWNTAVNSCLDIATCSTFIACANQLPYCR